MDSMSIFRVGGEPVYQAKSVPSIYGFSSPTLNSWNGIYAVKFGDTVRPVNTRIQEWKRESGFYSTIENLFSRPSQFSHDGQLIRYRDYSVHNYLAASGFRRIHNDPSLVTNGAKVSHEFFVNADGTEFSAEEVLEAAHTDIVADYGNPNSKYSYYESEGGGKTVSHYLPTDTFGMRQYQADTVAKSSEYLLNSDSGDFLLSAPTRSGKSFMAANVALRVCQGSGRDRDLVIVVSGVADVADEWKATFEKHTAFNQKEFGAADKNVCGTSPCTCVSEFVFLDKSDLVADEKAVENAYSLGAKSVVVFLTLQDLSGSISGDGIKDSHAFLNGGYIPTLVISDEAHFASFTPGGTLRKGIDGDNPDDAEFGVGLAPLNPTHGRLFVTATPFNALMQSTSSFSEANRVIITEADISTEAELWIKENPNTPEQESPYFGLPKKRAFVLDLGRKASELFDIGQDGFLHDELVKGIFEGMYGLDPDSVCPEVFSDENYTSAGMGQGVIFSFSRRAGCDYAQDILEKMFEDNGIDDIEIINVSSERGTPFSKMSTGKIKSHIKDSSGRFIILTANRLLTGVSIEKADTIVLCRGMDSAQFAVQAMGRVGTPHVSKSVSENGDVIKVIEKPNTAVISFDRDSMLSVCYSEGMYEQAYSSEIIGGVEPIQRALDARPLILYDATTTELVEATASSVIEAVLRESSEGGFLSWAREVNVDLASATGDESILSLLSGINGNSRGGLSIAAFNTPDSGDGTCRAPGCDEDVKTGLTKAGNPFTFCQDHLDSGAGDDSDSIRSAGGQGDCPDEDTVDPGEILASVQAVMVSAMLYAFLHEENFKSATQVANSAREPENVDMARRLGVDADLLDLLVSKRVLGPDFDQRLVLTELLSDKDFERPYQTFGMALASMGQFSDNELPTPEAVADRLVDQADFTKFASGIIDPAARSAVTLVQAYHRAVEAGKDPEDLAEGLWSIPTSGAAYEVIRAVYGAYGWNTDHILFHDDVTCLEMNNLLVSHLAGAGIDAALDMLGLPDGTRQEVRSMVASRDEKFDYAISNPPYQKKAGGEGSTANRVTSIFHLFQLSAMDLAKRTVMIYPGGRWMQSGGKGLAAFNKRMISDKGLKSITLMSKDEVGKVFPGVGITDGVSIVSWDHDFNNGGSITLNGETIILPSSGVLPVDPEITPVISKVISTCDARNFGLGVELRQSQKLFGIESNFVEKNPTKAFLLSDHPTAPASLTDPVKILTNDRGGKAGRPKWFWVEKSDIPKSREFIDKWQFVVKSAQFPHERGQIQRGLIIASGEAFGRSKVSLGAFDTEEEAVNFAAAMNTALFTRLHRETLSGGLTNLCAFVPNLGDYTSANPDIDWDAPLDQQLYDLFGLTDEEIAIVEAG